MKKQPPPLDQRVRDIANNPNLGLSPWQSNDLLEAAEELVRLRRLPELEWARMKANISMALARISREGHHVVAQSIMRTLDEGDAYVGKLLHRLNSVRDALEESHALNQNFVSVVEPDVLDHLIEHRIVIEQVERAIKRCDDE
jgi:hypothetical protein